MTMYAVAVQRYEGHGEGPPAPGWGLKDIALAHLEDGHIALAIDLADIMFTWWNNHPEATQWRRDTETGWWWGFSEAARAMHAVARRRSS
jgi:hypothetical protein